MELTLDRLRNPLLTVFGALSIIVLWYVVVVVSGVPEFIAPTPLRVAQVFVSDFALISDNYCRPCWNA
jgi:ABC-type nitrate/sulfonate/bicarbonate transport system permease component